MPKEVKVRKPIEYKTFAVTEELFKDFKRLPKLAKKDWRIDLKSIKSKKNFNSLIIRRMIKVYVKLRDLEERTGKKFKITFKEVIEDVGGTNVDNQEKEE